MRHGAPARRGHAVGRAAERRALDARLGRAPRVVPAGLPRGHREAALAHHGPVPGYLGGGDGRRRDRARQLRLPAFARAGGRPFQRLDLERVGPPHGGARAARRCRVRGRGAPAGRPRRHRDQPR